MVNLEHVTTHRAWSISGRYFGYWEGDDLWTHQGRHVGRLRGAEIYAPDGRYLGELMGNGRLAVVIRKTGMIGSSYIACPPRAAEATLPDLEAGTQRGGYMDFPNPYELADTTPCSRIAAPGRA